MFINDCFAACANATVLNQGSCTGRALGALDFFKNIKNKTKEFFSKTERWIEDKARNASEKVHTVWHQIGEKWESCQFQPYKELVNWAKLVDNATKDLANRTAEEIKIIAHNTADGFEKFKAKVKEDFQRMKNATVDAFKRFANRTREWFNKTVNYIKNVIHEAEDWIIEEGHSLKNKAATWWHKTKEGIENCTCCLIRETDEVLDEVARAAERALNKTKEKIRQWQEKLKKQIVAVEEKADRAAEKTKNWLQSLWPCICPRTYEPVCVQTPEGDKATILNQCFADCPKMKLTTLRKGTCEEESEA
jgi:ElaB/YqjD/DUF883 family membrane-anchored ribosome-binding protein